MKSSTLIWLTAVQTPPVAKPQNPQHLGQDAIYCSAPKHPKGVWEAPPITTNDGTMFARSHACAPKALLGAWPRPGPDYKLPLSNSTARDLTSEPACQYY